MAGAMVNFAWAAAIGRASARYGARAYRYIFLDAGHVAQSLHLACEAVGLGCCAIGAFYDEEVNPVLHSPREHPVIYLSTVGVKA